MRPVDHLLWPAVSRRWSFWVLVIMAWAFELPVASLSTTIEPVSGVTLGVLGTAVVVACVWTLIESRARFVHWRNTECIRRARGR